MRIPFIIRVLSCPSSSPNLSAGTQSLTTALVPFSSLVLSSIPLSSSSVVIDNNSTRQLPTQNAEDKQAAFRDFLLQDCRLSQSDISRILRKRACLFRVRSTQTAEQAVKLLRDSGFSEDQIRKAIVRNPALLSLKVDGQLKPKIEFMEAFGLKGQVLGSALARAPRVLTSSLEKSLYPMALYLQNVFGSKEDLSKALKRVPGILLYDVNQRLEPILSYLKQSGIEGELLSFLITRRPAIMTRNTPESLKKKIEYVRNMGIAEGSKTFIYALMATDFNGAEILEKKLKNLASFGLLEHEIVELLKKLPDLLNASVEKIQRNMDFLIHTAGLRANIVVLYPRLLKYSVETRMKPRYKVFECVSAMLSSKPRSSLPYMLSVSEENFLEKFVRCSPQAADLFEVYRGKTLTGKIVDLDIIEGSSGKNVEI